jgi:hypothetical protein
VLPSPTWLSAPIRPRINSTSHFERANPILLHAPVIQQEHRDDEEDRQGSEKPQEFRRIARLSSATPSAAA